MAMSGKALLGLLACTGIGICYGGMAGALYGGFILATQAHNRAEIGVLFFTGLFYGFLEGGFFGFFTGLLAGSLGGQRGWMVSGICSGWALFTWLGGRIAGTGSASVLLSAMLASGIAVGTGWLLSRAIKRRDRRFPLVSQLVESSWYQALGQWRWRRLLASGLLVGFGYLFVVLPLRVMEPAIKQGPARYFLPWGYVGWIKIQYAVSHASALPVEEGYFVYRIPPSGVLQTSDVHPDTPFDYVPDEFYYSDGKRQQRLFSEYDRDPKGDPLPAPMIWGQLLGNQANEPKTEKFFIGTKLQFEQWEAAHSRH